MKILITGSNGQLGTDCQSVLDPTHDVTPLDLPEIDITNRDATRSLIQTLRPDAIINCAAYTRVDDCESNEALATRVNADGPAILAEAAATIGAKLVHISTDYVFPGDRPLPTPYTEADATGPVSAYGRSKLAGETNVLAAGEHCALLRTAWLYGRNGANFPKTMLRLALADPSRTLRVVDDQYGSPTWSYRLAEQIAALLTDFAPGIYHATDEGHCTWYTFARAFLDAMRVPYSMEPCTSAEYPTPATRPTNSILENTRFKARNIHRMRNWREDVDSYAALYRDALIKETRS